MINRSNYDKIINEFGIENLDPILKASHENYLEIQEFYNEDDDVRQTIDLYFRKLERYINQHKEKIEKDIYKKKPSSDNPEITRAKQDTQQYKHVDTETLKRIQQLEHDYTIEDGEDEPNRIRKAAIEKELKKRGVGKQKTETKQKKEKATAKVTKPKITKPQAKKVFHITEDRKFIKRLVGFHNRIKSKSSVLNYIKALQKAIAQKIISKKSPFAKEIRKIQEAVIKYYNSMGNEQLFMLPEKELHRLVGIAGGEQVFKSIGIIKSYIGLQGKKPDNEKIKRFIIQIENAIKKGNVGKDDPFEDKVKSILRNLKGYKANDEVAISKTELNGLSGILKGCGCRSLGHVYKTKGKSLRKCSNKNYSDAKKGACSHNKGLAGLPAGAMTAAQIANMKFDLLPFTGEWQNIIGKPEKNFSLMIHGEPGAGKSTLLIKFAKYLANFGKVLYITTEEFGSVTLQKLVTKYLNPFPENLVFMPNLDSVKPSNFDFVIIDSVTDAGLKLADYKQLKADNPKTAFILVLQHTKDGQFRGGKEWEHEAQIVGEISNGTITISKNRYGVKNSWYFFDKDFVE